ncbi:MAG TPA: signal peptidase II [Firmicutes bacterium]|nr:signal peptidase II [Bacillota bacterium]HAV19880.1 signal peptidase II [Bacillota bacterium]
MSTLLESLKIMKQYLNSFFRSLGWLAILIVIVDQVTKWIIYLNDVSVTIIPGFFRLDYVRNTGAAWSMLEDFPWLLAIISFIAGVAMIAYFLWKQDKMNQWFKAALMLMIGGTWGNFIDRAFYQDGVIDFLAFNLFGYPFPSFNVADMSLVVGTFSLIIIMSLDDIKLKKTHGK